MVRCEECKAWECSGGVNGFCKRHSPRPTIMVDNAGVQYLIIWPSTLKDDGCMEGMPRGKNGKEG